MSRNTYAFRQAIILEVPSTEPFKATDGTPTDPDTVTLRIRKPDGTHETPITGGALTHASTGVYSYLYLPPQSGPYLYGFDGTGNIEAAATGEFYVEEDELS